MAKPSASGVPMSVTDEILATLEGDLIKEFGEDSAMRLESASTLSQVKDWVSSRSIVVDKVLAGGRAFPCSLVPFGRQMEIAGPPGVGKTTLCAQIAAEVQSKGGMVIATDTEERIDHPYWKTLGVDTSRIINLKAETLEDVFNRQVTAIRIIKEKAPNVPLLMLWDSVGGTSTDAVVDYEDNKQKLTPMDIAKKAMGSKARIIGAGMELINTEISKAKVAYVYTNHIYSKMGQSYGDDFETPGGNRLKYFATVRLLLSQAGQIAEDDEITGGRKIVGHKVRIRALKNSMAPIRVEMTAVLIGGLGYSNGYTVREISEATKKISKAGAWSTCTFPSGEQVKFQGWDGFQDKIMNHPEYPELEKQVIAALE